MTTRHALNESLERLRAELAASGTLPAAERERLAALVRDVIARVEAEGDEDDDGPSLADRFQEATKHFEDSHPNLTMAIGSVAEALSRLGI
jgi:hypothetical protein